MLEGLNRMKVLVVLVLAVILGWFGKDVHSQLAVRNASESDALLSQVLKHANVPLRQEQRACYYNSETVGDVVASLVSNNMQNHINRLDAGCFEQTCTISLSSCLPWETSECDQTLLKYETAQNGSIKPETFQCISIP
ncbi:conserved hypothetical protein [Vibrio nigripulchritudo SOn1]|uniref:MSHA biogenesis protein MshP n=2 Tax=Vibrio nigripulchritudo TaxID=28173 RepID=A0AAV2VLB8_9VIBR|nr:conserved hypothetical protein [Vibrio nigripulchritudo SOn1]